MHFETLKQSINAGTADFKEVIAYIDDTYAFTPTTFTNGTLTNAAGENNGSCKIFSFARLHGFSKEQTLACFGHFYRDHVLTHPEGTDHTNIRNFMKSGWQGIDFRGDALKPF